MSALLITNLLKMGLWPRKSRFIRTLSSPFVEQSRLLKQITRRLAQTEYGRLFSVNPEDDYATYVKKVPVVTYDHIRHLIERQKDFERPVLTADPILSFESTAGHFGKAKVIPYTKDHKESFYNAYALTFADLLGLDLKLKSGKAFVARLHKFIENEYTRLPQMTGLPENESYLEGPIGNRIKRYMVVPSSINNLLEPEDFNHVVSLLLLAEPNLEIISILSPSFLELLLDYMQNEADRLVPQLQRGRITREGISFEFKPVDKERAQMLSQPPYNWSKVWPNLKVISCWTSSHAALSVNVLKQAFPNVKIHPKGLFATEAPMTVYLSQAEGYVPCVSDVFFEFLDDNGTISTLETITAGKEYDVIISQLSGLYRYRIGDRVRFTHTFRKTPCLEFVGRSDTVSDIVGEKLNEAFARKCVEEVLQDSEAFAMLLPHAVRGEQPFYYLLTSQEVTEADDLSQRLDEALSRAFHYRSARQNGRLEGIKVHSYRYVRELFIRFHDKKGMKVEDMSTSILMKDIAKAHEFLSLVQRQTL
jgi:hypothetical protein